MPLVYGDVFSARRCQRQMAIAPPPEESVGRGGNLAQRGILVVVAVVWLIGLG